MHEILSVLENKLAHHENIFYHSFPLQASRDFSQDVRTQYSQADFLPFPCSTSTLDEEDSHKRHKNRTLIFQDSIEHRKTKYDG